MLVVIELTDFLAYNTHNVGISRRTVQSISLIASVFCFKVASKYESAHLKILAYCWTNLGTLHSVGNDTTASNSQFWSHNLTFEENNGKVKSRVLWRTKLSQIHKSAKKWWYMNWPNWHKSKLERSHDQGLMMLGTLLSTSYDSMGYLYMEHSILLLTATNIHIVCSSASYDMDISHKPLV